MRYREEKEGGKRRLRRKRIKGEGGKKAERERVQGRATNVKLEKSAADRQIIHQ